MYDRINELFIFYFIYITTATWKLRIQKEEKFIFYFIYITTSNPL